MAAGPDGEVAAAGGGDGDDGEDGVVGVGGDADASGDGDGSGRAGVEGTEALLLLVVGVAAGARESAIRFGAGRAWNAPGVGAAGVTLFDGLLGALVPMALVAVTTNV